MRSSSPHRRFAQAAAWLLAPAILSAGLAGPARASVPHALQSDPRYYDIGEPVVADLWVNPETGDDDNAGTTEDQPLRTVRAAWAKIPANDPLRDTGYRIILAAGRYTPDMVPPQWDSRHGTYEFPIIVHTQDGPGTVTLPRMRIVDTRYLYLVGLTVAADGGDVLYCEDCDHLLLHQMRIVGAEPDIYNIPDVVRVVQSQHIYIEDSDMSGAWSNAIDFVAVQYGHVQGNRIHNAGDWCMYVKGGSAYVRIEGNEIFDCGTGGFTAGQSSNFGLMVSPWVHYEAYDVRFINNIVHDAQGPGLGVNGGYNILLAYNTLYRVGRSSHALEFAYGGRSCDAYVLQCAAILALGGWGTDSTDWEDGQPIPNRNVYVYNNVLYNPPGAASRWQQFAIYGPNQPTPESNIPSPARADDNLQIRGNVIWNGPQDLPLGVGDDQGCQPDNPTCTPDQLRADNAINSIRPEWFDLEAGDLHPLPGGTLFDVTTFPVPDFPGGDLPATPAAPPGSLSNAIPLDFAGAERAPDDPPGAFAG